MHAGTDPTRANPERRLPGWRGSLRELATFIGNGGVCYACNLAILYVAAERLHLHYLVATTLCACVVTPLSWVLNRRLTFRTNGARVPELCRFALVAAAHYVIVVTGMYLLVDRAGWDYLGANVFLTVVLTLVNFAVMKGAVYIGRTTSRA